MSRQLGTPRAIRVDDTLTKEIVRRVLSVASPDRIILFGSAATGQMSSDSDIDLLVLEARPGKARDESRRIRTVLGGLDYPFDVIVMATDRFEETKDVIGGIAYPARKYGKVIFEAA
jgi:predicted nucleotidyltransferase